ncbi:MAG: Asp-tRNA(Asn)/Glu-tRNA(Gln) amidotransferase subunit GatB [Phycisphaerales bacterium]|nr:Asp-tRNA(Asn)/Glu-tRNA(Gln) amidotransferase subunit GatB [Phycisphaerales bacterium]
MSYADIVSVTLVVGLEVHVELATRTKVFASAPNPANPAFHDAEPNTLIDEVVIGLPGALPVLSRSAVEMSMMVGMALGCRIAPLTKWDRKSYFYPDLPKGYQISQYDLPVCFDGAVRLPGLDEKGNPDSSREGATIGIIRAHLEEDAGKLLHESPGGRAIDFSIADYNRAGAPLLEIVTQPDFTSAKQVVFFAKMLRNICRFLGVSEGVMQKGHMRFEPNINTHLTLADGRVIKTPIVEIKNLNSFRAVEAAIEHELAEQPRRWIEDRRVMGKGMKVTRGWDDHRGVSYVQREKEDAHDYRYFPDPDLPPLTIDEAWRERVRERVPELPMARAERYAKDYGLGAKEAAALVEERDDCFFYERATEALATLGTMRSVAGKLAANLVLQSGAKRANERGVMVSELGIGAAEVAAIARLREEGQIGNQAVETLFDGMIESGAGGDDAAAALARVRKLAEERGLLIVRDDASMERWCDEAIAAQSAAAADVRAGKQAAIGRLIGAVMTASGGKADAKAAREALLKKLK